MDEKSALDFSLLANFVHQVINPLNGVSGTLDNLIDGSISENRRMQRLRAARAQVEHCTMLVRNLAYFSQISLDPTNTNPGHVSEECIVPEIVIEAAMFFQELAHSKRIKIDLVDPYTQYVVKGSKDLLRQVFMNIFDNAVKYGDMDSEVKIEPWVQKHTSTLMLKITGQSPPIPLLERNHIFALGYRGAAARAKVASGTGLGLYICKVIIEEVYNGSIEVESSLQQKTNSFLIRFPSYTTNPLR